MSLRQRQQGQTMGQLAANDGDSDAIFGRGGKYPLTEL